jgi:endonuclease/exonuclease/phosphatase family metal-dependent hydrolase
MRLVTYNIHKGIGGQDRRCQLERIVKVIDELAPDLVCLQEVGRHLPRTGGQDQPRLLHRYFPHMSIAFQQTVRWKRGGYGNMVLSRWPLYSRHHVSLHVHGRKPRGAQVAVVYTDDGPMQLINWHLGLAEKERHWQADKLMTHPACNHRGDTLPAVLVGDFNDWRNTLDRGVLADHSFTQVTAPAARFRSFPAFWSLLSLDKMFYRGHVVVAAARVVKNELTRQASDHLPLVVDFRLSTKT